MICSRALWKQEIIRYIQYPAELQSIIPYITLEVETHYNNLIDVISEILVNLLWICNCI